MMNVHLDDRIQANSETYQLNFIIEIYVLLLALYSA
jgi:hypothetical protein